MAEQRQEWTWCDVFRAIGLAFSFSRLLVGFLGIAFLAVADALLIWAVDSVPAGSWGQMAIGVSRWVVAAYVFLFTAAAIAYSAKGELLEGEGARAGSSIAFVFRKFGAIFWSPVLIWIYVGLMAGFAFVLFMFPTVVARWIETAPYASLIWYAVSYPLTFLFSTLAMLGFLSFLFSLFLAPSIIAVRQEGALDAVLDTIDLMRGKGAFWVAVLAMTVASFVGVCVIGGTFHLGFKVAEKAMGEREFAALVSAMPDEIKPRPRTFVYPVRMFYPGEYHRAWPAMARTAGVYVETAEAKRAEPLPLELRHRIAGWAFGIWMLVMAGFAASFTLGAFVNAGTLTYLIIREEEEFLEPAAVETPPVTPKPAAPENKEEKETKEGEKGDDEKQE
jgi:hypothetical protein